MSGFSLVVDRDKDVFALTPLSEESSQWMQKNLKVISYQNATLINKMDVLEYLSKIKDNNFEIEVWNKSNLEFVPNNIDLL